MPHVEMHCLQLCLHIDFSKQFFLENIPIKYMQKRKGILNSMFDYVFFKCSLWNHKCIIIDILGGSIWWYIVSRISFLKESLTRSSKFYGDLVYKRRRVNGAGKQTPSTTKVWPTDHRKDFRYCAWSFYSLVQILHYNAYQYIPFTKA